MREETIFSVASGAGPAGVAVIRVSGPDAEAALSGLTGRAVFPPRCLVRVAIRDCGGELLDEGLAVRFPAPRSFTGEDVVELHVHGGRAVVQDVLEALRCQPGLRPAEAGEYARRAFDNGKLDLTAAEGLADLVQAETAAQRKQALRQMRGGLAELYDGWRDRLLRLLAHIEATIDFADEGLPCRLERDVRSGTDDLLRCIDDHLQDGRRGERLRDGIRVAIIGPPNAGKSSLLNGLARRDAAIVSPRPGTTRDVIEVHLELAGYPVVLADTAGLRDVADEVEQEGVRRSRAAAETADVKLAVFDGALWPQVDEATLSLLNGDGVAVINKCDLGRITVVPTIGGREALAVSALTGEGLEAVAAALQGVIASRYQEPEAPALTRARHREALEDCREALAGALAARDPELVAEDLRLAARALGRITGRVDVEEVLDVVFRDFCIGK